MVYLQADQKMSTRNNMQSRDGTVVAVLLAFFLGLIGCDQSGLGAGGDPIAGDNDQTSDETYFAGELGPLASAWPQTSQPGSCWVLTPSGCPNHPRDPTSWIRDSWGEAHRNAGEHEGACSQRKRDYDNWCGSTDTLTFFVQQPVLPTAPGCWVRTPSGCPNQLSFDASIWTRDNSQKDSHNDQTVCLAVRKNDYNAWCGAIDTKMHFVPQVPKAPGCWVRTPSGCPKQAQLDASVWKLDNSQKDSHNDESVCLAIRKTDYDSWCGITDTLLHFVPASQDDDDDNNKGGGGGTCSSLRAHELPSKVTVSEITLEHPIWSACYTDAESPPCNGVYYAGSDQHEYHAILYNADSKDGYAMVVLEVFDQNNIRKFLKTYTTMETKYKGHMQIRGLDFTPDGRNLVAYFGGGRGLKGRAEQFAVRPGRAPFGAKSIVVNLEVPSFTEKWKKQIFSQSNVMELSVAGVTQNLALSNEEFLIYTTGMGPVGPEGYKWQSGGCCHQWGYLWSVNAASGEQRRNLDADGPVFSSHSLVHGAAYSKSAKATLSFHTRDSKSAFILSIMKDGKKIASKSHNVWGGGYTSGATPGYVAASNSGDFGVVMSFGCTSEVGDKGHMDWTGYKGCAIEEQSSFVPLHQKDKVFFMKVNDKAEIQGGPKQIFLGDEETQIAPALQPLPGGKWLMAYTASNIPLWRSTKDYSSAHSGAYYQHMRSEELKGSMKSKLAILDSNGNLEGSIESPGKFPVELHPLKPRGANGYGWAYVEQGSQTVQISKLAC